MKKNKFLKTASIIITFLFLLPKVQAQFFDLPSMVIDSAKIGVVYNLSWKQDTNNLDKVKTEEMILLIGNKINEFMSYNHYRFMEAGRKAEREGALSAFLQNEDYIKSFEAKLTYRIFLNYPTGNYTYTKRISPSTFKYNEALAIYKWQLTDSTKTIDGYSVQRALTDYGGRRWIAWYTLEIPLNEGPYKFRGLPGLIIKMYDADQHYVFSMVRIERYEKPLAIEFIESDYVNTNRGKFLEAEEIFKRDIINRAKDAGVSADGLQTTARNISKRNNPIELK